MSKITFRSGFALLLLAALVLPGAVMQPTASAQQPGPQTLPQQQPPPPPKKAEDKPKQDQDFTLAVEVPLVNVDVVVTDNNGTYLSSLKKENFRILEDGQPQVITNFSPTEAPITVVLLVEYSRLFYGYFSSVASYMGQYFLTQLKPQDYVALITYDLRPRVEIDFTKDKREIDGFLRRMYVPGFSEANLFDAVSDTIDRLKDVKGKKAILILASGYDTFSKKTLGDVQKELRQTDVTIFSVGAGRYWFERMDALGAFNGAWGGASRTGYYQAENQLRAFAEATGGRAWFPMFEGQYSGIMADVAAALRNQYSIGYIPSNRTNDGKFRKIKVELVAPDGGPLTVLDEKGKKVKVVVYARQGYVPVKGGVS